MKITFGSIISYLVGIGLVLLSLLLVILSPWGLIPLLMGLLILPPIRRQLAKRIGVEFSRGATAGIGTLGVIIAIVVLVMAALSGGSGSTAPGAEVSDVEMTAQDASPQDPINSVEVRWNARAQSSVDPDPDDFSIYNSNEGQKYLVTRIEITNTGNDSIDLTPRMFRLRSDNVEYEYQSLFGSGNSLSDTTLNPGGSHSGWVAFSVPEDLTSAQFVVYQDAYYQGNISAKFVHDTEMDIEMAA